MRQLLIAVDDLSPRHFEEIERAVQGWARCQRVKQHADDATFLSLVQNSQIVFGWPQADWVVDAPVELLQLPSVGYEQYERSALLQKANFAMCNARGMMTVPVAEQFLAMLLALGRRIPEHVRLQATAQWQRSQSYLEAAGTTICIVGLGSIGQRIAAVCHALGMKVIAATRSAASKRGCHVDSCVPLEQLPELLPLADHVVLCSASSPETRNLFDRAMFGRMKPGASFYNVARGDLVDEDALVDALLTGRLESAGLDVLREEPLPSSSPLWSLPNVLITPHVGGRSVREYDRLTDLLIDNLGRFRRGEPLENAVIDNRTSANEP